MIHRSVVKIVLFVGCVCVIVRYGYAQKLPSFIKKCRLSDPKLNECMKERTQKALPFLVKGLPEFGVPSIDPLLVEDIKVDQPSLKVYFKSPRIVGLKDCTINEFKIDQAKKRITLDYTKDGSFDGKYKVDGQLLIIPIRGEGDSKIVFTRLNYVFKMEYQTYKDKNGKEHWKIVKHKVTYTPEKAQFIFSNLFNGSKQLADTATQVINTNWKLIFTDLSPPIMSKVTKNIVNVVDKFFQAFSIDEIFDP